MFNPANEEQVTKALRYAKEFDDNFYGSSYYDKAWNRFTRRISAYKMQHRTDLPKWKSKLHFPTFRLACNMTSTQFKESHRLDPFVTVGLENSKTQDVKALEKAKLAHYDLNNDLYVSKFASVLDSMYWFVSLFGCCVGRERITSDADQEIIKSVVSDNFGNPVDIKEETLTVRKEHTLTGLIHPLNFSHEITKSHFFQSRKAGTRFPMPISLLYKMAKSENPLYYQPGIKKILASIEDGKELSAWSSDRQTFYSETKGEISASDGTIIINEYSGDMNFAGNYDDNNLYWGLRSNEYDCWIAIGKSPYKRHPYWKMQPIHNPQEPYGDGPNDVMLPLNYWKNDTVNQYNDYMNATLKYMFEVYPGNILGGHMALIDGLPGGLIVADNEEAFMKNALIRPVNHTKSMLPNVERMLQYIESEVQRDGAIGNLKTEAPDVSDTATGVGALMQREASIMQGMMDEIDRNGIEDAMKMKMDNRTMYLTEPVMAYINENSPPVRYFPLELSGQKYSFYIKRQTPDVVAGKQRVLLKDLMALSAMMDSTGKPLVAPERVLMIVKDIGKNYGLDRLDEYIPDVLPPQVSTRPVGGGNIPASPLAPLPNLGQPPTGVAPNLPMMAKGSNALAMV